MSEEFIDDIITTIPGEVVSSAADANADADADAKTIPVDDASNKVNASSDDDATTVDDATPDEEQELEQTSSIEDLASQLGWKPDHSGENFVDAATYILRSKEIQDSMKDHNKDLKNQLYNLQSSVDALKEHNERVYKAELNRMEGEIARLKKERKAAIETADVDKVDELDQEINGLEKNLNVPQPKSGPTTNPIYDEWVKDNAWYLTNNEMATYADTVAQQYVGAPLERLYSLVRQKVVEVFPEHFQKVGPAQAETLTASVSKKPIAEPKPVGPASPVERGKKGSQNNSFSKTDLTPEQMSIMTQFVKSGIMTEDQYIKDISKLQEA